MVRGKPATSALLISDGQGMNAGVAPPALVEGLVLGLTRMGLLHNVLIAAADGVPDGPDGKAREWVTVSHFAQGPAETIRGRATPSIRFRITVAGVPAAEATLWLDATTGLPVRRKQTVHVGAQDFTVEEWYGRFVVADE